MSRTNYIFVDFENVQETDMDRIAQKPVKVILVLGEINKKLPVSLVKKLLQYAPQVQLVETGRTGKNAADLVLAHYIGEVKKADPHGYIHILSKDKGFDALIGHYKTNGSLAARHASFSEIPVLMNAAERATLMTSYFKAKDTTRPKKRITLESQMQAVFGKALSPEEVEATVGRLVLDKIISLSQTGEVSYMLLPTPPPLAKSTPRPLLAPAAPPAPTKPKTPVKSVAPPLVLSELASQALEHLRLHSNNRPKLKDALANYLFSRLGQKHPTNLIYGAIKNLHRAGYLSFIKQAVTYHF